MAARPDQTIKATLSAASADFPGFASFATANVVLEPSTKNAAIVKVTNLKLPDLEDQVTRSCRRFSRSALTQAPRTNLPSRWSSLPLRPRPRDQTSS